MPVVGIFTARCASDRRVDFLVAPLGQAAAFLHGMVFLKQAPDKGKVRDIVLAADLNEDGDVSPQEVTILFSRLLGIPEDTIPIDHEEVVSFSKLATEDMVDKLFAGSSREQVDLFHHSLFPQGAPQASRVLKPHPSADRVRHILDAMDLNGDCRLSVREVKILFHKLLGVPESYIGNDHKDVVTFLSLDTADRIEKICRDVPKATTVILHRRCRQHAVLTRTVPLVQVQIDTYYSELFAHGMSGGAKGSALNPTPSRMKAWETLPAR